MLMVKSNRRGADRFGLQAPYTHVVVRAAPPEGATSTNPRFSAMASPAHNLEGHAYDVSITGIRFELDEALDEGTVVEMDVTLPGCRTVHTTGRVVRVFDHQDDPGPRRMAAHFDQFGSDQDEAALRSHLTSGWCQRED